VAVSDVAPNRRHGGIDELDRLFTIGVLRSAPHRRTSEDRTVLLHNDRKFGSLRNNYALDIIYELKERKGIALGKYAR
jgi:hypothetical protein